jgi:hypothetical protein
MSCYLCAYRLAYEPTTPDAGTSHAPAPDPLGTCWRCWVLACSEHGARVGQFTCAICDGAAVTQLVIAPDSLAATAPASGSVPAARARGERAPRELIELVAAALRRIADDGGAHIGRDERLELALPRRGEPNLVTNLSEAIRDLAGPDVEHVADSRVGAESDGVSIDAVGAVVRELLANREIVLSDGSVETVTGALLRSVEVADESRSPLDAAMLAPWEMTHPILLDPVMWMVSTAVRQVSMGMQTPAGAH